MSVAQFKDFDKIVQDVFNDDFDLKHVVKVKTSAPKGVTLTTTSDLGACPLESLWSGKQSKIGGKVSAKWAHESGFAFDKFECKTNGGFNVETSLTGLAPGLKLEFKGDDSNKADLGATYTCSQATVTADLDVAEFSSMKVSALSGNGPFSAGFSTALSLGDKMDIKSFDVAAAYNVAKHCFSGLKVTNKFSQFGLSFGYFGMGPKFAFTGNLNYNPEKSSTSALFGGVYKCCPSTTMKAKVDTEGVVSASVKQQLEGKCSIVGALQVPLSDMGNHKCGVTVTLG